MASRAPLVGIGIYPDPRDLAFTSLLVNTCGFHPADITLPHNRSPTLADVREELDA